MSRYSIRLTSTAPPSTYPSRRAKSAVASSAATVMRAPARAYAETAFDRTKYHHVVEIRAFQTPADVRRKEDREITERLFSYQQARAQAGKHGARIFDRTPLQLPRPSRTITRDFQPCIASGRDDVLEAVQITRRGATAGPCARPRRSWLRVCGSALRFPAPASAWRMVIRLTPNPPANSASRGNSAPTPNAPPQ